ncbi:regulatory protein RecX [Microbacterium sp.]|uniref:regulatory protein RecX n=1 Tax=Microbacterium sp. TaxID=51671 RepID=UPI0039E3BD57
MSEFGGGGEGLAPVIPLFGGESPAAPGARRATPRAAASPGAPRAEASPGAPRAEASPHAPRGRIGGGLEDVADVASPGAPRGTAYTAVPLGAPRAAVFPDVERGAQRRDETQQWHATWLDDAPGTEPLTADEAEVAASAEQALLKRLRTRSLSEREARAFLREQRLSPEAVESIVAVALGHGYLDDARLAEQLIHSGTTRKGQGRRALAQSLAQRGIPREVIDAALAELPDDDAERALEFARQKARSMRGLDRDAALRRLSGQLARRGYAATALSAARQALDELDRPPARGVRFE